MSSSRALVAAPNSPAGGDVHLVFHYRPLPLEDVRWYSYRSAFSLKEVAKTTEVTHRGSVLRFCSADSAALEQAYRNGAEDLERAWWQEEAQLQLGSDGRASPVPEDGATAAACDSWQPFMGGGGCGAEEEELGVLVQGGHYEVDLRRRLLKPCYWPDACHRVLRGTWFADKGGEWVPLKESLAEQLEEAYRQAVWLPHKGRLEQHFAGFLAARVDLTTHCEKGLYALFASPEEIYLAQETSFAWLRKIGASASAGESRLRLRRGYVQPEAKALLEKEADLRREEAHEAAAATPVRRLVLLVHGIGQTLSSANIAQDAASFRAVLAQAEAAERAAAAAAAAAAATSAVGEAPGTSSSGDDGTAAAAEAAGIEGRVEVLPVQWRKQLSLEVDAVSAMLQPPGVRALRQVLHSTVVEVLLSMTPLHRSEILGSLVTSLNACHARFLRRNPGFKARRRLPPAACSAPAARAAYAYHSAAVLGLLCRCCQGTVSILAHSLGSVLCYDVLCNQPPAAYPPSAHGGYTAAAARPGGAPAAEARDGQAGELQRELARLRAENERLQLQLDLARAQLGSGATGVPQEPAGAAVMELDGAPCRRQGLQAPEDICPSSFEVARCGRFLLASTRCAPPVCGMREADAWWRALAPRLPQVRVAPLAFPVDVLIIIGSPLGVFLAMRGINHARGCGLGSPATAPLMRTAPGQPCSPDGLPAVSRLFNVFHGYDPVGHRLDPLALPPDQVPRVAYVPRPGGKRVHLAVADAVGDASSAASRLRSTTFSLLSSLAFRRCGSAKEVAEEGAVAAAVDAIEGGEGPDGDGAAGEGGSFREASDAAALQQLQAEEQQRDGTAEAAPQRSRSGGRGQSEQEAPPSSLARVTDGPYVRGSKSAQGRLDFALQQESALENAYLSALSSHFIYWTSPDVALFVLRAVHHQDVLASVAKQPAPATAVAALPAPAPQPGSPGGQPAQQRGPQGQEGSLRAPQAASWPRLGEAQVSFCQ
eukprot:scaffold7.g3527.t1